MSPTGDTALLVSADAPGAQQLLQELLNCGLEVSLPMAASMAQARARLRRMSPVVILLDPEVLGGRPLDPAVRELVRVAPVAILSSGEPSEVARLEDLLVAKKVEFLAYTGSERAEMVVAAIARRLHPRPAPEPSMLARGFDAEILPDDFGEILRHEINNPLTGILGNAELLLARRDSLPQTAVHRLETIAELAVRLRETIRRLSNTIEGRVHHARSA